MSQVSLAPRSGALTPRVPRLFPRFEARRAEAAGAPGRFGGLSNLWLEGVLGETSEIVWFQYFSVYALALGSSVGLVGFLAAISSLVSAAGSSLGAVVAERTGAYRRVAIAASVGGRASFLLMAVAPWLADREVTVGLLVLASLMKGFGTSFALPAWTAFAANAVPEASRTRVFAFRNFGRQTAGMLLTPLAGLGLGATAGMTGWQTAWLASFLIGLLSVYFFARVPAGPAAAPAVEKDSKEDAGWQHVRPGGVLFTFVASAFVFQVSVMLVGPFFAVYLVRELDASPFWLGMTAAASPLSAAVTQALLSRFAVNAGSKPMLIVSNLGIVAIPLAWLFVTAPWHVCVINLAGGGLWATSQLASFNLLLAISPGRRLPSFTALHQAALSAAGFAGPLLGGLLIPALGFHVVLLASAAGRLLATGMLCGLSPAQDAAARASAGRAPAHEPVRGSAGRRLLRTPGRGYAAPRRPHLEPRRRPAQPGEASVRR